MRLVKDGKDYVINDYLFYELYAQTKENSLSHMNCIEFESSNNDFILEYCQLDFDMFEHLLKHGIWVCH